MWVEALDLRFRLKEQTSPGDVVFMVLSTTDFPKSASVQEA